MSLRDLLEFARAFASLGDAIGEQAMDMLEGTAPTAGAAEYMRERLARRLVHMAADSGDEDFQAEVEEFLGLL